MHRFPLVTACGNEFIAREGFRLCDNFRKQHGSETFAAACLFDVQVFKESEWPFMQIISNEVQPRMCNLLIALMHRKAQS